jgi:Tfp pilus assembly protein PilO
MTKGQVVYCCILFALFVLVLGFVGKSDMEAAQAVNQDQANVRQQMKDRMDREATEDRARAFLFKDTVRNK